MRALVLCDLCDVTLLHTTSLATHTLFYTGKMFPFGVMWQIVCFTGLGNNNHTRALALALALALPLALALALALAQPLH